MAPATADRIVAARHASQAQVSARSQDSTTALFGAEGGGEGGKLKIAFKTQEHANGGCTSLDAGAVPYYCVCRRREDMVLAWLTKNEYLIDSKDLPPDENAPYDTNLILQMIGTYNWKVEDSRGAPRRQGSKPVEEYWTLTKSGGSFSVKDCLADAKGYDKYYFCCLRGDISLSYELRLSKRKWMTKGDQYPLMSSHSGKPRVYDKAGEVKPSDRRWTFGLVMKKDWAEGAKMPGATARFVWKPKPRHCAEVDDPSLIPYELTPTLYALITSRKPGTPTPLDQQQEPPPDTATATEPEEPKKEEKAGADGSGSRDGAEMEQRASFDMGSVSATRSADPVTQASSLAVASPNGPSRSTAKGIFEGLPRFATRWSGD